MGIIYKVTSPSGRVYIGQTTMLFKSRWNRHVYTAVKNITNFRISYAIRKYGGDAFTKEILFQCANDKLDYYEIKFIAQYRATDRFFGYNLTAGGSGATARTNPQRLSLSELHRERNGNNLPKYIIKTGCKIKSGYQITGHPKCARKRFTGDKKDDAKSLQRAIKFLKDLDGGKITPKEKLPKFVSYMKGHDSYCVQIPIKDGPNKRKEFRDKKCCIIS